MALLARFIHSLIGVPSAVPAALIVCYPELQSIVLRRGGVLPRLGGWCLGQRSVDGITMGRRVWLGPGAVASAELLLHELAHVHQFQALSAFPLRYWWESLRVGYRKNRFEMEARGFAARRLDAARSRFPQNEV